MPPDPISLPNALTLLNWSQRQLAWVLDVDDRQIRRWARGSPMPPPIAAWLTLLADFHRRHPPPEKPADWDKTQKSPGAGAPGLEG